MLMRKIELSLRKSEREVELTKAYIRIYNDEITCYSLPRVRSSLTPDISSQCSL
jgi:hypothetical protein